MRIHRVQVKNFRLLRDVSVVLEPRTTLIVGRNNSGKTSLTELFKRLLSERAAFRLEDFSLASLERFIEALKLHISGADPAEVRKALPAIEVQLTIRYELTDEDLGPLTDFIVDLDPDCTEALIIVSFEPSEGKLNALFEGCKQVPKTKEEKAEFYRKIKEKVPNQYGFSIRAVDPRDETNSKSIEWSRLSILLQGGFINAQRGLDDTTDKDKDVLGKVLEGLLVTAGSSSAGETDRAIAQELAEAVSKVEKELQAEFGSKLDRLLPSLSQFGYPGLRDPRLVTETTLDVQKLLSNHTRVRYAGVEGLSLPETYNGLGIRNLIFILLQLHRFFKDFKARPKESGVHLIFIEEPEAHLHPQMQEVFIRQIETLAEAFERDLNAGAPWPVQFVITTHSPHMANEANFETIRYFLGQEDANGLRSSRIKDLREGLGGKPEDDRKFLHQYLTLTRCDLFFADKAVLIEGTAERLLLPKMIEKIDGIEGAGRKLSSQYLATLEVGGAYAHRFFSLIEFLELPSLVITDLDSVCKQGKNYVACVVSEGTNTSNGCLKDWFEPTVSLKNLLVKTPEEKTKTFLRLAFQIPETNSEICGRSFEEAFVLANPDKFSLAGIKGKELESRATDAASAQKKSEFALRYAIEDGYWNVPKYIAEGLQWLAQQAQPPVFKPANDTEVTKRIKEMKPEAAIG